MNREEAKQALKTVIIVMIMASCLTLAIGSVIVIDAVRSSGLMVGEIIIGEDRRGELAVGHVLVYSSVVISVLAFLPVLALMVLRRRK